MNTKGLLDQLMNSGQALLREQGLGRDQGESRKAGGNTGNATSSLGGLMSGFGGGTLAGGALGMFLGNKRLRSFGGKTAAFGGVAALGALAYRAYSDWQAQQQETGEKQEPRTIDRVSGREKPRSRVMRSSRPWWGRHGRTAILTIASAK